MATDNSKTASMPGRYASALFDLAKEQNELARVEGELKTFQAMMDESEDLRRLVRSPVFSAEDQQKALVALMSQANISGLTANFLQLIAKNRRLFATADMIKVFCELAAEDRGEVRAEVTSAVPLTDAQLDAVKSQIKSSTGRDVQVDTSVDASLLGGLIVKVGSRMIDSSLRTKLTTLKMRMKEVG